MKITIALLLFTSVIANIKVSLMIKEHEVHYNQTEEYDPLTQDVISCIPSHQRDDLLLHEVQKIENEGLGILIWKLKEDNCCSIGVLNPTERPTMFFLDVATLEARNVTVDMSMVTTVYVHAVDDGPYEGDRSELTTDMQDMCEGKDIRKLTEKIISRDEFDNLVGLGAGDRMRPPRSHCCGRGGGWGNPCLEDLTLDLEDYPWDPEDYADLVDCLKSEDMMARSLDSELHIEHWIVASEPC